MKKTVVIDVVALSNRLIGEHTPFLKDWIAKGNKKTISPLLPGLTCSAQSTYLTGKWPSEHGIVGNGWYFRDECEIKFWRQSNRLVQSESLWDVAKRKNPNFTSANMFWWYNMYSNADIQVTPRPLYPSDGRKIPDCHSFPMELRDRLQKELGQFPLFSFWGPNTNISSSKWIAEASKKVDEWNDPTLTLIYLPHLDYNLQRFGIDFSAIGKDLRELDEICQDLITFYEKRNANIILLSEYGITNVHQPIHINRILRKEGYISVKNELGVETMDAGTSKAFAVSDHQIAHIYIQNPQDIPKVKSFLENIQGIEQVLDSEGKKAANLDHERTGELMVVADKDSWFTYYFWLDDAKAPDYARCVDIHRKPGYDPVEMIADPNIKFLKAKIGLKILKKKLGFRYLMDLIPLDATLIKGSHGRIPEDPQDFPVFVSQNQYIDKDQSISPIDIKDLILKEIFGE